MIGAAMIEPSPPSVASVPSPRSHLAAWAGSVGVHGVLGLAVWGGLSLGTPSPETPAPAPALQVVMLALAEPMPAPAPAQPVIAAPQAEPEPTPVEARMSGPAPTITPPPPQPPRKPVATRIPAPAPTPASASVAITAAPPPAPAPLTPSLPSAPVETSAVETPAVETPAAWSGAGLANPPPPYPRAARVRGQEGVVLLRVRVAPDGQAADVHILETSGVPDLDSAAAGAVRHWRFQPARRDGRPITGTVDVPVRFRLKT